MDVGTDFLFGRCVKSLDAVICQDETFGRFSAAFNEAAFLCATRVRMYVLHLKPCALPIPAQWIPMAPLRALR